jgi:two-component system nitrogen regulation response regulator NtrX
MVTTLQLVLIDDNRAWLDTLAECLEQNGFEVRTAEGGKPGLELLEQSGIRVAVVDGNMPEMDGMDLLRELKERQKNVAVVVLSGEEDPELPQRFIEEGAKAFLSKSTAPIQLIRALVQALLAASFEVAVVAAFSQDLMATLPCALQKVRYLTGPEAA